MLDLGLGKHPAPTSHQELQQAFLRWCKAKLRSLASDLAGGYIELKGAKFQNWHYRNGGSAQKRAYSCDELAVVKGLCEIVVGAGIQPCYPLINRTSGSQHEHRRLDLGRSEISQNIDSIFVE